MPKRPSKKPIAPVTPFVAPPEIKLDLGCGRNLVAGFTGVDFYAENEDGTPIPGIIKCDLFKHKTDAKTGKITMDWSYRLADNSVTEIVASHFCEHIPRTLRWPFYEECWRILKVGGIMRIFVPSWKSERSLGDMTHEWPPVTAFAYLYLSKAWMTANKLTYGPYDLKCNFDHAAGPTAINPPFNQKAHEVQVYSCTHMLEVYQDMWVTLTKLPL
jgi:hypothetical protein